MIEYKNSFLRRIVFPFYSAYEAGFVLLILGMIYVVFLRVDPQYALPVIFFAYTGASIVSYGASPARLKARNINHMEVEKLLCSWGFKKESVGWVPPLPRFVRWPHNKVTLTLGTDRMYVDGPAHILARLLEQMKFKL